MTQRMKSNIMLVLAALIWGSAFVAQSVGMDYIGPFTFNAVRCLLGGVVLIPVAVFFDRGKKKEEAAAGIVRTAKEQKKERKTLVLGGLACGAILTVSTSLQQVGMVYTTAGKAGFITALYILIVPLVGIFIGKKVGKKVWIGVFLAVIGMYLLCVTEQMSISYGDFLVLLCAVAFTAHILTIDHISPKVDGVKLSCIQFLFCGAFSSVPMFLFEHPQISGILQAWLPIAYAGILSCGVAYTFQILAQKHTDPTVASLLMSLESVFAVLTGWLILREALSAKELFGCILMFAAIILAQLPEKGKALNGSSSPEVLDS